MDAATIPGCFTFPSGEYEPAREIAVGDYVFFVFGPPPACDAYSSGPYEVAAISGPEPQRPVYFLDSWQPGRAAWNGRSVIHLTLRRCPDSPSHYDDEPYWSGEIRREDDGMLRREGGTVWVRRRGVRTFRQAALFGEVAR